MLVHKARIPRLPPQTFRPTFYRHRLVAPPPTQDVSSALIVFSAYCAGETQVTFPGSSVSTVTRYITDITAISSLVPCASSGGPGATRTPASSPDLERNDLAQYNSPGDVSGENITAQASRSNVSHALKVEDYTVGWICTLYLEISVAGNLRRNPCEAGTTPWPPEHIHLAVLVITT
jgi:hypothetical protein